MHFSCYTGIKCGVLTGYWPGFEVSQDFSMAERQQIESKLKKCFILAVNVI